MAPLKKGIEANNSLKMQMNTSEPWLEKSHQGTKGYYSREKGKVEDCSQGRILMRSSAASRAVDYLLRKQQF